jgi:hypothetical protein
MSTNWKFNLALVAAALATAAQAAPTPDELARLGKDLTPIGAERAGNKDGTIPEWTGGVCTAPADYKPKEGKRGFPYADPFAADKPTLQITAANLEKHADKLDAAQVHLLKTYPSYRIDVYPTRRSACFPNWAYENTVKRAANPKLTGDAPGLQGAHAQFPFPVPKTGQEAMWNFVASFHPVYYMGNFETIMADANGNRSLVTRSTVRYRYPYWDNSKTESNELFTLLNINESPASKSGSMDLRATWPRMDEKEPRAWSYTPGQRRVRLAPEFTYDTVAPQYGGLVLFDELNGFDGKMDRFDFKIVGKKELYIPYNSFKYLHTPTEEAMGKNHVNPDTLRWELHRVWVVEATRKPGARHVYSKKVYYLDEDSWLVASYNSFDDAGKLYRSSVFPIYEQYDVPMATTHNQIGFDHVRGGWFIGSHPVVGTSGWRQVDEVPSSYFAPDSMAAMGVR